MKKEKEKSFMDTVREIDQKEREEQEAKELELEKEREERDKARKKAYEEKLRREKIELIKLKEGEITKSDIIPEKEPEKHYSVWQKIGNFFYHEKIYIIIVAFTILFIAFIVYSIVTTDHPDMTILYLDNDYGMQYLCEDAGKIFSPYVDDVNGDGEKIVSMYFVPEELSDDSASSMQLNQSYRTQIVAEFQSGDVIMVIGTERVYEEMGLLEDNLLEDMTKRYPDDENATTFGYKLSGTTFKEQLGYEGLHDDLYISFRTPQKLIGTSYKDMEENYNRTLEFFDRYIKENRAN